MASTANSFRLCLRAGSPIRRWKATPRQANLARRALSTTPVRWAETEAGSSKPDSLKKVKQYSGLGAVLRDLAKESNDDVSERSDAAQLLSQLSSKQVSEFDKLTKEIAQDTAGIKRPVKKSRNSFWNDEEPDSDMITDEVGEDDFEEDDIMALAHGKLEEHREYREYARIAVWEMPLLSRLAKPFEPPKHDEVLRFRYTSYMGEFHPADKKVVVQFCPDDLQGLTDNQRLKLMKLAGSRYNPDRNIVKMSCERFEHQAQNKRYLGDLVNKMIEMAKDPTDTFEDIPLDTRHHKSKAIHRFPKEWRVSEGRLLEIEAERNRAYAADEAKRASGGLVDGVKRIQELAAPKQGVLEPVMAKRGASARKPVR